VTPAYQEPHPKPVVHRSSERAWVQFPRRFLVFLFEDRVFASFFLLFARHYQAVGDVKGRPGSIARGRTRHANVRRCFHNAASAGCRHYQRRRIDNRAALRVRRIVSATANA
jgi:hypothetical protein